MVCTFLCVIEIVMLLLFACSVNARTSRSSAAFKNDVYFSLLKSRSSTYQERPQTDLVLKHFTCFCFRENEKVRENLSRKRK